MKTRMKIIMGSVGVLTCVIVGICFFLGYRNNIHYSYLSPPTASLPRPPPPSAPGHVAPPPATPRPTAPGHVAPTHATPRPTAPGHVARPHITPPRTALLPKPPPRQVDRLGAIDGILEKLELGNIAFNAPRSMNLHNTAMIQLLLGLATPTDELKRMIEAEGVKEGARIRVSDRMEARLSGPNFAITAITPEIQAVSRSYITEWKWEVKPIIKGSQYLHLTLSALLSIDGVSTPRAIRTFDKVIDIEVTWQERVVLFVEDNWQWLWAVILVPIGAWLGKKWINWIKKKGP
jgi:hypothetical protein